MATEYDDDGYDDDGFANYEADTVDPSYYLLVATGLFCIVTNMMIPCLVSWARKRQKRKQLDETMDDDEEEEKGQDDDKVSGEAGQEVPLDASALRSSYGIRSQNGSSRVSGETSSKRGGGEGPLLTRGVLARFTNYDVNNTVAVSSPSHVPSYVSRSTNRSHVSSVASTMFDAGYVPPVRRGGRGARRWRGAKGRYKAQQTEVLHSIRNLDDHHQTGSQPVRPQSEYAQSEISAISSLRPQSLPAHGSASRRNRHRAAIRGQMSVWKKDEDHVEPGDAADSHPEDRPQQEATVPLAVEDVEMCCGERAWWRPYILSQMFDDLLRLAEWDRDSKRLVELAVPFSVSTVVEGVWELLYISMIAQFIGTSSVVAYTVSNLIIGLSEELVGGVVDTVTVLCPHALGAGNENLAGQYVQITALIFALSMIPVIAVWLVFTDDLMLLFGYDEETARIAQEYANVLVFSDLVAGIVEAYTNFLYCIDLEKFLFISDIAENFVWGAIFILVILLRDTNLTELTIFGFLVGLVFTVIDVAYPISKGWISDYLKGMVGNFAFKNVAAVKRVVTTAVPLCFGHLLSYGEWEVLTVFAAYLGPAEVAVWGILGTLWEVIEATSSGFADAGEIRCAYHLGAGRPEKAKTAGFKCILLSVFAASLFTSILFIFGENLALWFTSDPTLQRMLVDLIPLLGLGNVTLTAGGVCWSLVGAQGRYRLATIIFAVSSWGVTLPLAALFTYGFNINLQGITAAVVVGYSVPGTVLTFVLFMSDWDGISRNIVEENAVYEESHCDEEAESIAEGCARSIHSQSSLRSMN